MPYPPSRDHYPNLPARQRMTQWLVDRFNGEEAEWRRLREKLDKLVKRHKGRKG